MTKKYLACALGLVLVLSLAACGNSNETTATGTQGSEIQTTQASGNIPADTTYFSDSDEKDVTGETPDALITLDGPSGTISDTTRGSSGSAVTITSKGIYRVSGTSDNVSIIVNDTTKSGNVYLILDNVTMTNGSAPCIVVEAADKVIIQCVGTNTLTYTAVSASADGAIYAKDDVTVNGSGSLTIDSALHGIVSKNDVKITGASITLRAQSIGVKAGDSVRIGGGEMSIVSGHDGIQVSNSDGTAFFYMEDGTLEIRAEYDGIDVGTDGSSMTGYILMAGGTADITAGGGSENAVSSSTSQKGLKCDGNIQITGGNVTVSSADDALHSDGDVYISGGTLTAASSDDGIHADQALYISGGTVDVTKAYEGLEAYEITISGGETSVYASDDGLNAAGGSDTSSAEAGPSFWGNTASTGTLTVSGGKLYVNAGGDGLDSNGSLYVTGGFVIVEGPTNSGNGALDCGDGNGSVLNITGGTVLATGSSGMAVNFDSGTQCAALVSLSGTSGTTISVDDGSGFSFTASKNFECLVYSSPSMTQGNTYTITAGSASASADFSSGLYYSNVSGQGSPGGGPGGHGGK